MIFICPSSWAYQSLFPKGHSWEQLSLLLPRENKVWAEVTTFEVNDGAWEEGEMQSLGWLSRDSVLFPSIERSRTVASWKFHFYIYFFIFESYIFKWAQILIRTEPGDIHSSLFMGGWVGESICWSVCNETLRWILKRSQGVPPESPTGLIWGKKVIYISFHWKLPLPFEAIRGENPGVWMGDWKGNLVYTCTGKAESWTSLKIRFIFLILNLLFGLLPYNSLIFQMTFPAFQTCPIKHSCIPLSAAHR